MTKLKQTYVLFPLLTFFGMALISDSTFAFGFESKMQNVTSQLISTVLPLLSILGLVYASILAISGDAGAKARIITVISVSLIGFLAPAIIQWLQHAVGGF
ncbi:MAG: hypothetical protein JWQ35_312 [Bacteriovoracaceae bacterium]|nr:hypothetical protein [Bacteriovoracaceae bacterium]